MNWFRFLLLVVGPLVILIGSMIYLPPFQDVIRMFMSIVPFLVHLDP